MHNKIVVGAALKCEKREEKAFQLARTTNKRKKGGEGASGGGVEKKVSLEFFLK